METQTRRCYGRIQKMANVLQEQNPWLELQRWSRYGALGSISKVLRAYIKNLLRLQLESVDMLDWSNDMLNAGNYGTNAGNSYGGSSGSSSGNSMMVDEDYMELMTDTLFSTISSNQPLYFPDPREIGKSLG